MESSRKRDKNATANEYDYKKHQISNSFSADIYKVQYILFDENNILSNIIFTWTELALM